MKKFNFKITGDKRFPVLKCDNNNISVCPTPVSRGQITQEQLEEMVKKLNR